MPRHTILGAWHEADLVMRAFVRGELTWNCLREYIGVSFQRRRASLDNHLNLAIIVLLRICSTSGAISVEKC